MSDLSTPKDFKRPVDQVQRIIELLEKEFAKNPTYDDANATRKTVTIEGDYSSADRYAVCTKYIAAGWGRVTGRRKIRGSRITNIFTFTVK
jgi:hypothetical protein